MIVFVSGNKFSSCKCTSTVLIFLHHFLNILQVARHLAKLFDSISRLKFVLDEQGQPTKEATGMYSKDGEYVDFDKPCSCVGQVGEDDASQTMLWCNHCAVSLNQGGGVAESIARHDAVYYSS